MSSARILGKPDLFWLHQAESSWFKVRATDRSNPSSCPFITNYKRPFTIEKWYPIAYMIFVCLVSLKFQNVSSVKIANNKLIWSSKRTTKQFFLKRSTDCQGISLLQISSHVQLMQYAWENSTGNNCTTGELN